MTRRVFDVVAALSLLTCVAVAAMWVRSYWRYDAFVRAVTTPTSAHRGTQLTLHLSSHGGRLFYSRELEGVMVRELQHGNYPGPVPLLEPSSRSGWTHRPATAAPMDLGPEFFRRVEPHGSSTTVAALGLRINREDWPPAEGRWVTGWNVTIPYWMLAAFVGVPSFVGARAAVRRRRRRQRNAADQCERCGYDLRATPGRCPECGKSVGEADHSGIT